MNDLIMYECQLDVRVRKYPIDIVKLQNLLRSHKQRVHISNQDLADILHIPLTQVEHYFRTDKYFAIPDYTIWNSLKDVLQIQDTTFDLAITEFLIKPGVFEKTNRIYGATGISPTLMCGDEIKVLKLKKIYPLRYQRTEYAKRIRKDYEAHLISERRCNMREWTIRTDGISNSITTVEKDTYLVEVKSE